MIRDKLIFLFNILLGSFILGYTFYKRVMLIRLLKEIYFSQIDHIKYNTYISKISRM